MKILMMKGNNMAEKSLLGINTVHIDKDQVKALGLKRMEICIARQGTYEDCYQKACDEMDFAEANEIPYSIHLPIQLFDWFEADFLDAFFLDSDPDKRALSLRLLEANLKGLEDRAAEYYVIHFPGVYLTPHMAEEDFEAVLSDSLDKVNTLAKKANKHILLEYFGSNKMFSDYREWTKRLASYSHLGILVDTGHLYYSSLLHAFDFDDGLNHLSQHCEAFHLWTTKGDRPYSDNDYYKKYHHISVHPVQQRADGWAFDALPVVKQLIACNKPIVLEATPIYEGASYFYDSIKAIQKIVG